jgi:hypothetical protein
LEVVKFLILREADTKRRNDENKKANVISQSKENAEFSNTPGFVDLYLKLQFKNTLMT